MCMQMQEHGGFVIASFNSNITADLNVGSNEDSVASTDTNVAEDH